ncbi:thiol reductant ABC exporter subunit CydD [Streptomyces sparsogenes]|uniref:thiol reductant ABC exporter subunit CydD n=1 Tax=Streptomyces sparsogenes TaxID=67365 RepID=UPI0009A00970|nr:thiol reductant ABC exporter subunit CydD [Streptomyces sparsogenes]
MKPVDPRLLRHARATRLFLAASVALGLVAAGLVVAQAMLIAEVVVAAFVRGAAPGDLGRPLALLAAVAVGRAAVAWLTELAAHRAGAAVKSELRMRLLAHAVRLGPERMGADAPDADAPDADVPGAERPGAGQPSAGRSSAGRSGAGRSGGRGTGELTTLATRGIDALDDYFARYLPQLGLAIVVPVAVLARILTADWVSALIIAATLPLIPLFMILIGWATQSRMDRQWRLLSRLSGHFLDVVAGLPTLKVFGRAKAQAASIRAITADYRRATLRTLRLAFLSSFALELLSTVSVALVAVGIGMRLVHGELDLYTGLVVLVLAPEAYLPLRQVGTHYHAAAEGLAAADEVFAVLEREPRAAGDAPAPDARGATLSVEGLEVRHPGRSEPSLAATSFEILPGETVALVGPSGAGKTTLLNALLGFAEPTAGRVLVAGRDLASLDPESWRRQIAWVPQRPYLFAGTIADNVRLARPDAHDAAVRAALRDAGALGFVDALPHGAGTRLGEMGAGLSAGQRQRIALARAFLADRPVLLLDEPTAGLDGETEAAVVEAVRRLAEGRTVLLVVHRPALLAVADRVVRLPGPATAPRPPAPWAEPAHHDAPRAAAADPAGPQATTDPAGPQTSGPQEAGPQAASDAAAAGEAPRAHGSALAWVRESARDWRGRFTLALLLATLASASAVGLMAVSGWLISRAWQQPPVLYLMVAVTATRAFGIGRAVFRYAERLVSHDAVLRVLAELRVAVYRRLERLAPVGLRDTRRGDLLSRLVADVDALQDYFLRWLLPVGAALAVGVASVGFTGWLLPEAGAVLAAGLVVAGAVAPLVSGALARHAERRLAPARGALSAQVVEVLTGTAELTVAGALPRRLDEVRRVDGVLTRIARRAAAATGVGAGLSALACGLTVAASAWVGVRAVADGRLGGVWLAVVVLMPLAAFEAVAGLPLAVQHRQRVRRAARRVYDVVDGPPVEDGAPVRGNVVDEAAVMERPAKAGAEAPRGPYPLVLDRVSARYPGRRAPALDGFDLELRPGHRVAVVGPSGSGKTTLAHVLLRFLDPRSGSYTLAGRDTAAMDPDAVRRLVGLCAQDAHIFDSSLRENLRLARPDASDGELRRALAAARLLTWVDGLPEGLDTLVGESGARLSGGQRQRLALARALLADFPVLVLDEPAEHLDLPTADALTADLLSATRGRTTVLITHRLAGLEAVDEVVVLEEGRTVQRGTYAQLASAEGPFRRMLRREAEEDGLAAGAASLAASEPKGRAAVERESARRPRGTRGRARSTVDRG